MKKADSHKKRVIGASMALAFALFLLLGNSQPAAAAASDSLSVTVTPPLYQLTIGPGDSWTSTLKIINSNPYDVTFYAQVAHMQASGEDGRSRFVPVLTAPTGAVESFALARWIHMSADPIFIKAGASMELPFTVDVPLNAEPGGHYAAILVGTQPLGPHATGTTLKVSSYVSSLLFVRIKGDVIEKGRIREFLTTKQLYQTPKADFLLRFENTGNTHVLPQGDITLYNMWGKERGNVLINQGGDFGNVLPKTVRRFEFSWEGEQDLFDIGLYSAVVTLAYGQDNKQNVTKKTYFWVVPLIPVATGAGVVFLFIFSLIWFIRRYIRRALELEQRRLGIDPAARINRVKASPPAAKIAETLMQPIKEGVVDLRSISAKKTMPARATQLTEPAQNTKTTGQFLKKYRLFGLFLLIVVLGSIATWYYFSKVLVKARGFQITDVHIQEELSATSTTPSIE